MDDNRPEDFPYDDDDYPYNAGSDDAGDYAPPPSDSNADEGRYRFVPHDDDDLDSAAPDAYDTDYTGITPASGMRAVTPRSAMPPVPPDSDAPTPDRRERRGGARARHEARKRRNPNLSQEVQQSLTEEPSPSRERRERSRGMRRSVPAMTGRDWIPQASRGRSNQALPTGNRFNLPGGDNWRRWIPIVYVVGSLLLIIGIIVALNLFKNEDVVIPPDAIWIGTEWTYENRDIEQIRALAGRLKENNISNVYAWVSWLKEDGTWAGKRSGTNQFIEMEPAVRSFVQTFREVYPEATLYGWLGFPVELGPDGYRLDEVDMQERVADFSLKIVEDLGFDGVFLNVEQVWDENADDFVNLLIKVRSRMGDAGLISVAIPPDWSPADADIPVPPLIRPGTEWEKRFKQRVALLSDQMAIMAYNSGLSDPNDYVEWVAYQVQTYAAAVHELGAGAQIIIGIPTYDNELPGHDTTVENVPTAITGIKAGLLASGEAAVWVQGVAMYAEWTTTDTEWQQYFDMWARARN